MTPNLSALPSDLIPLAEKQWDRLSPLLESVKPHWPASRYNELLTVSIGSDFVVDQLARHPEWGASLCNAEQLDQNQSLNGYKTLVQEALKQVTDEPSLLSVLRLLRQQSMVRLIWRDLTRKATMQQTVLELSWMADALIDGALEVLYQQACDRWGTPMHVCETTGEKQQQRMVVLGMGKLGAHELNLSSDIDLIFTFPEKGETEGAKRTLENQEFFIRLGQKLIHALDTMNGEGFVFRVDMRLRPFGSASPLALSFAAMEHYYQDQGREWERYAMIKARVVAGDKEQGAQLMAMLKPFVYRKYLDYGAFESLREMKEMINREVRRKGMELNVKLGPGGIREVEFIAQAFQLIRGGRDSRLQQRELLTILPLLPELSDVTPEAVEELIAAYIFLRNIEHAIQAIADKQTQELPTDDLGKARLAFSMGFDSWQQCSEQLKYHREIVRAHFEEVIAPSSTESADQEQQEEGNWLALWSGHLDEAESLAFISDKYSDDPEAALKLISELRDSRTVQVLQPGGVERLKRVLPVLLEEVSQVENPTQTLNRIMMLIHAILRRSAYLVLLHENPAALQQLVKLCSSSAWFADQLAKKPVLLDELIDPRTLYAPTDKAALANELRQQLLRIPEDDIEQLMEALRYFKSAHLLRVAAADITGVLPLMKVSDYLTWLAEVIISSVLDIAWRLMLEKHGRPMKTAGVPADPDFIVLGYGKLGGIELSYGSDLDLVFIHDCETDLMTDGAKPIANAVFFTRLGQRMIHILNTFTAGGQLYEVDMRLRPSGNSGLLVSSLKAFGEYQNNSAWTWEHQALVRARVIAGASGLSGDFNNLRQTILAKPRDLDVLQKEVADMRQKMRTHLGSSSQDVEDGLFNLKQDEGGIVDIEFLVQYLVLAHADKHPALCTYSDNIRILEVLQAEGLLPEDDAVTLQEAYKRYRAVGHRLALQERSKAMNDVEMTELRAAVTHIWKRFIKVDVPQS
ncbi:bifunctional [glutamate--ammonia ligase]-adenylyl-L-tyrosine phosphorylase/[glutamate--ammonia-ligase] adenylyltransferase [Neptunomonas phycophila]|uniref:bifunctional [glutamate--ammonia ligase]-adenylyl-L-tyrosine phosphorylase/[glutamate--ammonia-ligase] adenylyltransferase n=1 Tax=Neptunomonas phycophila TaxID=1572645 RepID=UPI00373676EE